MKSVIVLLFALYNLSPISNNDAARPNDYKIARAVRQAVRDAGPDLLKSKLTGEWREYLKLAAMDLEMPLQPLVLIKFDEDISFRNQLKKIVEWEASWHRKETRHYIYYYHWDHPLPELILEFQDAHYQEISTLFGIEFDEKIPYRYDVNADKGQVYPFEDLRGGIVSPQPFDLEKGALAMFYTVNPNLPCLTKPLARIYGSFFQNESTAEAYYQTCLEHIKQTGYTSAAELFDKSTFDESDSEAWYSAYAFVYLLNKQFGPRKIVRFLSETSGDMEPGGYQAVFQQVFEVTLQDFENRPEFFQTVQKL